MNQFIILFGSNTEAEKNVAEARKRMALAFPEGIRFSENHRSPAISKDGLPVPDGAYATYLNTICIAQSDRPMEDIQLFLKRTEAEMGRKRGPEYHGVVVIDLDLVQWNGNILRPKDANQSYYKNCLADLEP